HHPPPPPHPEPAPPAPRTTPTPSPQDRPVTRGDFVGRVCVIRTGRVTADFGQAEVTAEDGSTATVQVRTATPEPALTAGRTALIFDYDAEGEHFLVAPFDPPAVH
ncbi:hypothetical protein ACIQOV_17535, partial [Kitasatospora sp. NPDC091257]